MAARFGRNKRRRMREELAQAHSEAQKWNHAWLRESELLRDRTQKLADLREMVDDAKIKAGRMSVLFPPTDVADLRDVPREAFEDGRPIRMLPEEECPPFPMEGDINAVAKWMRYVDLYPLIVNVQLRSEFPTALHCRVRFKDMDVAWAASEVAMRAMTFEQLQKTIVQALARDISERLYKLAKVLPLRRK